MNTPQITTSLTSRLAAMAFSAVFTLAMLLSVDQLAAIDTPATKMAHTGVTSQG